MGHTHKKTYDELNKATINVNDAGLNLEQLDIEKTMALKLSKPEEVKDVFLVIHYKLQDKPI